ncbi:MULTISPECIES: SMI1/KNR4 family protein [Ruminococcus]|uniref:SMI1/KNR4 family protein n=1 Tax=Ruminococcus TaxID=1263 RepID=UPI00048BCF0C|nr:MULTISPECIES: SMI1/KNR4 family protein [Ruminococcus]MCR4637670.1 SMI1/KNR4 family protein [Ruminococcus sp.]
MFIPEIPNNSLTEKITAIAELSRELEDSCDFEYSAPNTEEEILAWETENDIKIPEALKDWLRFSGYSDICNELAVIRGVGGFEVGCELVPEDMVIIGEVIGDGEFIGFSSVTGKILREDHGDITEYGSFSEFLDRFVIRMLRKS